MRVFIISFFLMIQGGAAICQMVKAEFTISSTACKQESITATNSSVNSNRYEWDLCQGDLNLAPTGSFAGIVNGSNIPTGLDVVYDGTNWYCFITSRANNSIMRLSFGDSIGNVGETVNLGNISSLLDRPTDIKIVISDGKWYGFVYNEGANVICRLDFGTSLNNVPSATVLHNEMTSTGNQGLDVIHDGINWYVVYTINSKVGVLRLATIESIPLPGDKSITTNLSGNPTLGDIKLLAYSGLFYAYTTSYSANKLYKLEFGADLHSLPVEYDISTGLSSALSYYGVDGGYDAGKFYLFLATLSGSIVRVDLGIDLSGPNEGVQNLGSLGVFSNVVKNKLVKQASSWYNLSVDYTSGNIYKASFPTPTCQLAPGIFTDHNLELKYNSSGIIYISLRSYNGGEFDEVHKSLVITSLNAPAIDFINQQMCVQSPVLFIYESDQSITSQSWDFGDSQTSLSVNPQNTYTSSGTYNVKLNLTSSNGCLNKKEGKIKIYDPPTSAFKLPPGLICTNNEFTFTNTTTDNFDGNLTYEWLVNDVQKSTSRDFKYAFNSEGNQQIKLKTSIPGCSNELTQTLLNVQTGPVVGFSYIGKCEDETITFTNESAGSISGFQWNLGNGNTSVLENPSEIYSTYGNYNVSLLTTGTNGCVSTLTKPVNIYSVPQTNFSLDLPPFACSGSLSQFNDLTPPMADSNISFWAWSFGDLPNGSSSQKNPLYTYSLPGDYSVSLTTMSNFGCSNSIQKTVTIYPSPKADFSFKKACVNQSAQFLDSSTGDIKSWLWTIQSNTYSVKDPIHIFKSAGNRNALLTVTGTNNCISQISKNVNVPVPVVVDFTASGTCATKPALFDEISKGGADPAASWTWDFDGQVSSTEVSPIQYTFPSTGIKSVTMQSTRKSGCTYSVTQDISIEEPPRAKFTVFLESGAAPFTVDLTNESTKATKYLWRPGDPKQSNSTLYSPSFTYTELGDYMIELEASNELGCKDQVQQPIHVVVPQINAAVSNFKLEKVPGSDSWKSVVTIENKSNVALIDPDIYLDISGNALIKEKIIGVIKPSTSLTYTFTPSILPRAVDYACAEIKISSDEYQFDNRQCMNVADQFTSMTPYPNPADDELILEWINISSEPMDVIIYNVSGQEIISRQYSPTLKGLNQVKVDVSNLQVGIYFVSYSVDGQTQNFKFSVVR